MHPACWECVLYAVGGRDHFTQVQGAVSQSIREEAEKMTFEKAAPSDDGAKGNPTPTL